MVILPLQGPNGQVRDIEVVIDTGYGGYLTLPPSLTIDLGLDYLGDGQAYLADGTEVEFDVYNVTVLWDGHLRDVNAAAVGSLPLAGMKLLYRHNLNIDVEGGGRVVIQAMN